MQRERFLVVSTIHFRDTVTFFLFSYFPLPPTTDLEGHSEDSVSLQQQVCHGRRVNNPWQPVPERLEMSS